MRVHLQALPNGSTSNITLSEIGNATASCSSGHGICTTTQTACQLQPEPHSRQMPVALQGGQRDRHHQCQLHLHPDLSATMRTPSSPEDYFI